MAVAAVRLDELQAAGTALALDAHLEELPAATPSAECAPDWALVLPSLIPPSAGTVLAEGAFTLVGFTTVSVAGETSGIRGMADMVTRATTIRTGGGIRHPLTTMTRIVNLHWPAR